MALELPGSFALTAAAPSLSKTNETVYLLEERKDRTEAVGSATVPSHYIKVIKNLNAFVQHTQSNTGAANGIDDSWALSAISHAHDSNLAAGESVAYNFPASASAKTFKVGSIAINDGATADVLVAGSLAAFNVMMTASINNQGVLTANCAVTRASGVSTQVSIADQAGHAQYLYFDNAADGANDIFNGTNSESASKPPAAWQSGGADDVEDNLSATLTNQQVEDAYSSAISTTNDSVDGENVLQSWSLGINAVAASNNSDLTKHARANVTRTGNPASSTIFKQGDKLIASDANGAVGKAYTVTISDFTNNPQTIVTGTVYGFFEQGATGALA